MGVSDGQPVSAAITNPAFLDANADDFTIGTLGMRNVTGVGSGFFIDNIQRYINTIAEGVGLNYVSNYSAEADTTLLVYNSVSPATLANGTTFKQALTNLANKFSGSVTGGGGHTHSGIDGQGPKLPPSSLLDLRVGVFNVVTGGVIQTVGFAAVGSTNYAVAVAIENLVDPDPIFLQGVIVQKGTSSFNVLLNAPADTDNYYINYQVTPNI